jgi:hypothetical protein
MAALGHAMDYANLAWIDARSKRPKSALQSLENAREELDRAETVLIALMLWENK